MRLVRGFRCIVDGGVPMLAIVTSFGLETSLVALAILRNVGVGAVTPSKGELATRDLQVLLLFLFSFQPLMTLIGLIVVRRL